MNETIARLDTDCGGEGLADRYALANRLRAQSIEEGDNSGVKKDAEEEEEPPVEKPRREARARPAGSTLWDLFLSSNCKR